MRCCKSPRKFAPRKRPLWNELRPRALQTFKNIRNCVLRRTTAAIYIRLSANGGDQMTKIAIIALCASLISPQKDTRAHFAHCVCPARCRQQVCCIFLRLLRRIWHEVARAKPSRLKSCVPWRDRRKASRKDELAA